MINKKKEKTVKDILNIFLPKIWVLFVVGAIFATIMGGYSVFLKKDRYTTTMEVYVSSEDKSGTNTSQIQTAVQMVKVYERFIYGDVFLDNIRMIISDEEKLKDHFISEDSEDYTALKDKEQKKLITVEKFAGKLNEIYENGITVAALKSAISVKLDENTSTFVLSVTSSDKLITSALARVLVDEIEKNNLLDEGAGSGLVATIFDYPENDYANISANSKNTLRNSAIAFAIGFILAAAAVWVYSMFDVVIRDVNKIEENIDVPILGVIPRHEISVEEGKKK